MPQTYMQFDIAALQYVQGRLQHQRRRDDLHLERDEPGEMFINGVGQGAPVGNKILMTVWDGNGVDTYDFSNYDNGVAVDLRPAPSRPSARTSWPITSHYTNLTANAQGQHRQRPAVQQRRPLADRERDRRRRQRQHRSATSPTTRPDAAAPATTCWSAWAGDDRLEGVRPQAAQRRRGVQRRCVRRRITVTLNGGTGDVVVVHGGETDTLSGIENIVGTALQ